MIFDVLNKHLGVEYIYEEYLTDIVVDLQEIPLTTGSLQVMPKFWLKKLSHATLEANNKQVMQLIDEIPVSEEILRRILIKLARQFQYEQILDLIEPLIRGC